jgi:hypothetical protein
MSLCKPGVNVGKFLTVGLESEIDELDHGLAFGLIRVTEATWQRLANQQHFAYYAFVNFDMSEVRYLDSTIFLIKTSSEDSYVEELVDFIKEVVDSDPLTPLFIRIRDPIFQSMEIEWPDVCEAKVMYNVGLCYTALMGDYLFTVETVADNYAILVEKALKSEPEDIEKSFAEGVI